MEFGAFTSGLLTGLREGVEAALIVAIILAYLEKTGNRRHFQRVFLGVGAAVALSVAVGVALWVSIGGLPEPAEQIFEAAAMIAAAGVVTWMLFWMRRVAANMRGELQAKVDRSLTEGADVGPVAAGVHRGHPRGNRDLAVPHGPGVRRLVRGGRCHGRPARSARRPA